MSPRLLLIALSGLILSGCAVYDDGYGYRGNHHYYHHSDSYRVERYPVYVAPRHYYYDQHHYRDGRYYDDRRRYHDGRYYDRRHALPPRHAQPAPRVDRRHDGARQHYESRRDWHGKQPQRSWNGKQPQQGWNGKHQQGQHQQRFSRGSYNDQPRGWEQRNR